MTKDFSVKDTGVFLMLFTCWMLISPVHSSAQTADARLVSVEELGSVSAEFLQLGLIASGAYAQGKTVYGVAVYKLTYHTIDVFGNPTTASGAVYVPQSGSDSLPIISYQHGTIMNRDQVPSSRAEDPPGLFFSGYGYVVAMPDFLGLGDNPGLHPYLHWESEATASIDMLRAAREFLTDSLQIRDNQLFLAGYSQGGHATMALHKYIHDNQLQDEFIVEGSAPMSGPYALSQAQFDHIFRNDSIYTGSYFIPYIISSYQYVYGNLYADYSAYYDPPYDSIFEAWETSGNYFEGLPIDSFPKNFYTFMQDSVMTHVLEDPKHPLRVDLRKNDLHNWAPAEPVRMLYCGSDMTVSPENATMTQDTMKALGATDIMAVNVNPEYNHTTCAIPAFLYALDWFERIRNDDAVNGSLDPEESVIRLYPNPASHWLTVETDIPGRVTIRIHSISGRLMVESTLSGPTHRIDLSAFRKGIYVITIRSENEEITRKIVKH